MISARFYDQLCLVVHRVHCAMAFRCALKMGDGLFTPPEVVPAGGGLHLTWITSEEVNGPPSGFRTSPFAEQSVDCLKIDESQGLRHGV
jgi:hypothetical protein